MILKDPLPAYLIHLWSIYILSFYQNYYQIWSKIANLGHQMGLRNVTLYRKDSYPLLLEYFITSLKWLQKVGRSSDSISDTLMVIVVLFLPNKCSTFKQNNQFQAPDQGWMNGKCDTVWFGHASIAAWVLHDLPWMYMNDT